MRQEQRCHLSSRWWVPGVSECILSSEGDVDESVRRAQALREQLEPLRRRLYPTRRAHRAVLRDRDLAEIAVHV